MYPMDAFKEVSGSNDMLIWEDLLNLDCTYESYEDLQTRYSTLHTTYIKEIENSKKVKKSLDRCLKLYAKLCKKLEAQQKVIDNLEKNIHEKITSLEESYKNQEKLKGLIDVYKTERSLYCGETNFELKRDKELLLDICCQLISETVKTNNIRNLTNLILRKFKKDLDSEKLNLLKSSQVDVKKEITKAHGCHYNVLEDIKPFGLPENIINKLESQEPKINKLKEEEEEDSKNTCAVVQEKVEKTEAKLIAQEALVGNLQCDTEETLNGSDLINSVEDKIKEDYKVGLDFKKDKLIDAIVKDNGEKKADDDCEHWKDGKSSVRNEKVEYCLPILEEEVLNISESQNEKPTVANERMHCKIKYTKTQDMSLETGCDGTESCIGHPTGTENNATINSSNSVTNKSDQLHVNSKIIAGELFKMSHLNQMESSLTNSSGHEMNEVHQIISNEFDTVTSMDTIEEKCLNESKQGNEKISVYKNKQCFNKITVNDNEHSDFDSLDNSNEGIHSSDSKSIISSLHNQKLPQQTSIFDVPGNKTLPSLNCSNTANAKYISLDDKRLHGSDGSTSAGTIEFPFKTELITRGNVSASSMCSEEGCTGYALKRDKFHLGLSKEKNEEIEREFQLKESLKDSNLKAEISKEDLSKIFDEMACVRLLSPIKDVERVSKKAGRSINKNCILSDCTLLATPPPRNHDNLDHNEKMVLRRKRDDSTSDAPGRNKKFKAVNSNKKKEMEENCSYVDSILMAMSRQAKELKSCVFNSNHLPTVKAKEDSSIFKNEMSSSIKKSHSGVNTSSAEHFQDEPRLNHEPTPSVDWSPSEASKNNKDGKQFVSKNILQNVIQKFVSSSYSSKEEAERIVKDSISILERGPDEVIARIIVSMVFENISEEVLVRERPVPPLTNTQYHLITLLSVFKAHDIKRENIIFIIQKKIFEKLFTDTSLWPDDVLETVSRFYMAICKNRNDPQTCWKFFFQAMCEMQHRSCVVVFTALKVWPDILHKASTQKVNILAVTMVNIFLHMPNDFQNANQKKKLLGLKHLLTGFYEFKVEETIEKFAEKLLSLFYKNDTAADKSVVLLTKCRTVNWTRKYIVPKLCSKLKDWPEGQIDDLLGVRILGVIEQLPIKQKESDIIAHDIISCLSNIINTQKLNHDSEKKMIEILLTLKVYKSARETISVWNPKEPISESLKMELVNVATDGILRELKPNRCKEQFEKKNMYRKTRQNSIKSFKGKTAGHEKKALKTRGKGIKKTKGKHFGSIAGK